MENLKSRLTALMLLCLGMAGFILCRSAVIQLTVYPRLEKMALRQYQSHTLVRPRRGLILDRNGVTLAANSESQSLAANPMKINHGDVARPLSKAVGVNYKKLLQKLHENREFTWIKRHLNQSEVKRLKRWNIMDVDGEMTEGLWLVNESIRAYPLKHVASQVLGGVNVDSEGLEGVELWFNEWLRGNVVSVKAIKDALGRPTFIDATAAKTVQDGETLSLTIDASLQFEVEQHLKSAMQRTASKSGTVIVMNATSGEILAMANEPTFNANDKRVVQESRRNRAVTDGFEPGSTFKTILVAAALSNGMKLTDKLWAEEGSYTLQGHKISEAEVHEKFGWIDISQMLKFSSNIGAAKLALKVGADRYLKMIQAFGFGKKTELSFPGEISGRIPPRKQWSPLAIANIGFGQGILVTPLQMTRAYAAILNGGFLVKPTLISTQPDSTQIETGRVEIEPQRIFSQKVSDALLQSLQTVIEEGGTGVKAALPGFKVAGKTGTAQMVDPHTHKYSRQKHIASFIGFAVGVEPKIVIFTLLAEPKGSYYATTTAAPLFKEVLASVAHYYDFPYTIPPPPKGLALPLTMQRGADQIHLSQAQAIQPLEDRPEIKEIKNIAEVKNVKNIKAMKAGSSVWNMPLLKGLTPLEVFNILKGHKFKLEFKGNGIVEHQVPESGNSIAEGGTIRLKLVEP